MNLETSRTALFRRLGATFIFCLFLLPPSLVSSRARIPSQQSSAAASPAASLMVKLPVVVMNEKRQLIDGLTKDDFSVWEGKQEREISYFQSAAQPASVGVLIDVSGSVRPETLSAVKHGLAKFLELAHAENEYFVGEFGEGRRELVGWTRDAGEVLRGLDKLAAPSQTDAKSKPKPHGQTPLYDACAAALNVLAERPTSSRVLLLFSDGLDNQSRLTFKQLRGMLGASGVLVYSIATTDRTVLDGTIPLGVAGQAILDELAAISGGSLFIPDDTRDKKQLEKGMTRIAAELRHQYVVGFALVNPASPGKANKIKIKLTPRSREHKRLILRSRDGYFTPVP